MNIQTTIISKRDELLQKLYVYYENKVSQKKSDWESQINRAKYKAKCQAQGRLECVKGHKLNGESISCGNCKGDIYWVDGPTHYRICSGCQSVCRLTKLICGVCDADVYCEPKFSDYIP